MLANLFGTILDALLPPRPSERVLRGLTLEEMRALPQPQGDGFEALLPYHDPRAMALVWELKYRANPRAAALAAALFEEPLTTLASEELGIPLLLPVPMHPVRQKERGFNQTELLCVAIRARLPHAVVYAGDVLARVRHARPQQGLPRALRLTNAEGTMGVRNRARVEGRACIVIDDVATTGATLREARRALLGAGARAVHCVALAG